MDCLEAFMAPTRRDGQPGFFFEQLAYHLVVECE